MAAMSSPPRQPSNAKRVSQLNWEQVSLADKLKYVQAKRARYEALAADPNLSPAALLAAKSLARSYAAAERLYHGAAAYEAKLNDRAEQARLMRSLGITPLDDL